MKIDSIYQQIDEQRQILVKLLNTKSPIPPTRISDVCMKLSILNELLGDSVADLKDAQLSKEEDVYIEAKADGKSDTGANALSRFGSRAERHAFTKAETKHKSLWKLISMAQSHIRASSDEMKGM